MFWTSIAHAMGSAPGGEAAGSGNVIANFLPFILMLAVFYFLLIRPQQKRAKEHKAMLAALKRGDKVVTSGGLHGVISEAHDDVVVVDLGQTKVTVGRAFIAGVVGAKPQAPVDKKAAKAGKDSKTAASADAADNGGSDKE